MLIRTFFMERFLERVSLSEYKNNFILKGGMLVSSLIGVNARVTIDIDATLHSISLSVSHVKKLVNDICGIEIDDGTAFSITKITTIMEDFDYPGVRVMLEGTLDRTRQTIKLDFSTDDAITPHAIEYSYPFIFENRNISLYSYNVETLLAEELQTMIARGIANTRLRNFYDIYSIVTSKQNIDVHILKSAFAATCNKRETRFPTTDVNEIAATL